MAWGEIIGDLVESIVEISITSKRPAVGIFIIIVIVVIGGVIYLLNEK